MSRQERAAPAPVEGPDAVTLVSSMATTSVSALPPDPEDWAKWTREAGFVVQNQLFDTGRTIKEVLGYGFRSPTPLDQNLSASAMATQLTDGCFMVAICGHWSKTDAGQKWWVRKSINDLLRDIPLEAVRLLCDGGTYATDKAPVSPMPEALQLISAELQRIANIGAPFALKVDKQTGKVAEPTPDLGTVKAWGLARRWPQWLVEAMGVHRYPNQVLTEREAEDLALSTAGTPLGAQKAEA